MKLKNTLEEADDARAYLRTPLNETPSIKPFAGAIADIRDDYYSWGDGVQALRDLESSIPRKDSKLSSLIKQAFKVDKDIYNHLNKNYKGWD